jgi:hypothetical protein
MDLPWRADLHADCRHRTARLDAFEANPEPHRAGKIPCLRLYGSSRDAPTVTVFDLDARNARQGPIHRSAGLQVDRIATLAAPAE